MSRGWTRPTLTGGLLLAIALAGCVRSANEANGTLPPDVQAVVETYATDFSRPEGFEEYWRERAPERDPIDDADIIVAGRVYAVTAIKLEERQFQGHADRGWLTRVDLSVRCPIKGGVREGHLLSLNYWTPIGFHRSDAWPSPHTLGPGQFYLLMLKRPAGAGDLEYDPMGDPPPVPLEQIDPASGAQGSPDAKIAALVTGLLRAPDGDLAQYALPVLGYLAGVRGQSEAHTALMRLAQSDDPEDVRRGITWLTGWGRGDADLLALAERRSADPNPTISGQMLALRIEVDGTTALLREVALWLNRPGVTSEDASPIRDALDGVHPEAVTEDLLRQYALLISPEVSWEIREPAVRLLGEVGTMDVAPLLVRALDDRNEWIVRNAMAGLARVADAPGKWAPRKRLSDEALQTQISFWQRWWEAVQAHATPPPWPEPPAPPVDADAGLPQPGVY